MPSKTSAKKAPATQHETRAHHVTRGGVSRLLGVRLVSLKRNRVTGEMPVKSSHMNMSGRVNGGAIMAFADAMGAIGTVANLPPGYRTATLESKTNFFAAGVAPALTAVSIPLHIGRTTMVWQTTVRNGDGRKVAIVTQTQIVIPAGVTPATDNGKSGAGKTSKRGA